MQQSYACWPSKALAHSQAGWHRVKCLVHCLLTVETLTYSKSGWCATMCLVHCLLALSEGDKFADLGELLHWHVWLWCTTGQDGQ